jgi:DNA-binding LytR/AlgR family response regulator
MIHRALIVDDEPLLRAELRDGLAQAWPALEVVAQAGDGLAAIAAVAAHAPDVVFMDISMPRLDGMAAAQRLRETGLVGEIVFVTAHEQHAVRAFEQRAVDYLVKPLQMPRLAQTVQHVQARLSERAKPAAPDVAAALMADLRAAIQQAAAPGCAPKRQRWLRASRGQQWHLVAVEDVACLRAADGYTQVITRDGEHLIDETLKSLLAGLDPEVFVQVHRAVVVNLHFVAGMRRERPGHYRIELRHGLGELPATKSLAELLP